MASQRTRFQWQLDWKSVLAIMLMLPVLVSLGCWQLRRADEKRVLLANFEERRLLPAVNIADLDAYPNYRPVYAVGEFDPEKYWLLDNRISHGRFGYEIMAVFIQTDGSQLLVDRGWIEGDASRRTVPAVTVPKGLVSISGELYRSEDKNFSLGSEVQTGWPRRQQWLDIDTVKQEFQNMLPVSLRLDESSIGAFQTERLVVNVTPAKHTGYAVQWFAMALALGIIFIFLNTNLAELLKRRKDEENKEL
ncbi:SURF1 family protein [Zhongshania aquimaris]|uniref:SURF1-like protein n=1 Tax=Zhongshania aquimaris TaxID=2857107 RepID=A0ABS6VS49_9GAMM|nr:SURF1 family protein [Zhongshania aquimaris]MBW2941091.1 SURF1 family protein [Zhongshania aquimaris]